MELKETNHRYHCSESNYYVNGYSNFGRCDYNTWKEFKDEWLLKDGSLDDDYNHCFRFDIIEHEDDSGEPTGIFELWLFFILQRKGNYRPVWIKNIAEEDMTEIQEFLEQRWEYLKGQWSEFNSK